MRPVGVDLHIFQVHWVETEQGGFMFTIGEQLLLLALHLDEALRLIQSSGKTRDVKCWVRG